MTTLISTPSFFSAQHKTKYKQQQKHNNIIYTFGKGINRENNKYHISESRGSALDDEEHIGEWRIALEGPPYAIMKNVSKHAGGGCMNENAIHGAPNKRRGWRIALSNHYTWLQTRGGGSKNENTIHGAPKKG